ncbi:MAG: SGNH/GDSL hydrolase family protein [Dactylosporangium sp.]|nr:SGNH/GDSL hydrolase family protein [Dactylosporangium sp.]NNJ60263.1 SGNH/GDSL hydrolase family protein [Dactylosporangium sp.]
MKRRWLSTVLVGIALIGVGCKPPDPAGAPSGTAAAPAPAASGYPSSMAALGDSITLAFGACLAPAACPRNSWATGNGTRINSHYKRIVSANPAMREHAHNFASGKATVDALAGQAASAGRAKVDYVTILIGANDACHGDIAAMTSVAAFRQRLDRALDVLARDLPDARVLVISIPNVYRLWEIGHTNRLAVKVWSFGVCPALLANPTSTAPADTARRAAFRDRIAAYNAQLVAACATHRAQCRDDGGAAHRTAFALDMLNVEDFFHPNTKGQNTLARVTYPGRFDW